MSKYQATVLQRDMLAWTSLSGDRNVNRICTYGCLFSIFIIVGCGSSNSSDDDVNGGGGGGGGVISGDDGNGSVEAATANNLQGSFASACVVDADDGTSEQTEFTFAGNNVTASSITSFATALCDGVSSISLNASATFSIDGTQTPLAVGSANNIDLIFSGGSITGSPALLATLQSQGTTLAAFLAAQGFTGDVNNLSTEDLGLNQAESFDIFRIDTTADGTDRLIFGDTDGSFTGDTPALRPISLDPDPDAALLRIL